jgi:signal transduction histidine kinase
MSPKSSPALRKSLVNLLYAVCCAGVLAIGFAAAWLVFRRQPALIGLAVALMAGLLAYFGGLLHSLVERLARRWAPDSHAGVDPSRILREYSLSLSSLRADFARLDADLLASTAIGLISEALGIQRGFLFIVSHEKTNNQDIYSLQGSKGMGGEKPAAGTLRAASPIAEYFNQNRNPIRQQAIDTLPEMQTLAAEEKAWFHDLKTDLYIPVHAKDQWIGLFALGPKGEWENFTQEDLWLLSTLADQTAVVLQNARLVESLIRVNNDFRRAYAALEKSNRQLDQSNRQLNRTHAHLEKLDHTKSDFIAISSHELRTPLTVIRGYSEMLLEDTAFKDDPIRAKIINSIHAGILRMHEIVDGMLDMASIDNRTMKMHVMPVTIYALIQSVCESLKKPAADRNLTVEIMEQVQNLPNVEADPDALRKVFHHLIINAIKYTPDGGKIAITGSADARGRRGYPEESIEIVVSDTGIGIDTEYLELIFTKFYQTGELAMHSTGKTKFKGAGPGLGLSVSQGIVEAHGGLIWAESTGHDEALCPGSQFHVILPLKQEG